MRGERFSVPDGDSSQGGRCATDLAARRRSLVRDVLHLRGVPLAVIANWLGHADAATTARICAHSQDDALLLAGKTSGTVVTSW